MINRSFFPFYFWIAAGPVGRAAAAGRFGNLPVLGLHREFFRREKAELSMSLTENEDE